MKPTTKLDGTMKSLIKPGATMKPVTKDIAYFFYMLLCSTDAPANRTCGYNYPLIADIIPIVAPEEAKKNGWAMDTNLFSSFCRKIIAHDMYSFFERQCWGSTPGGEYFNNSIACFVESMVCTPSDFPKFLLAVAKQLDKHYPRTPKE